MISFKSQVQSAALSLIVLSASAAAYAAEDLSPRLKNRTIAYVVTNRDWGVYQTAGAKEECPNGQAEWGPREQFKKLFLDDGKKRTYEEAQLGQESAIWFPKVGADEFPYKEVTGKISYGLNLDGKVDANDFTGPDGEKGIDNELYRVIGCNDIFRGPTGIVFDISNQYLRLRNYSRLIIELTDVDSLADDDNVTVSIYRGQDRLLMDASGKNVIPGGTQRIDTRWSARFENRLRGKITGGVLTTESADITIPYAVLRPGEETYMGGRLQLKLTPERAEGVLAGYVDVDDWYIGLNKNWATVFQSYGRMASQSMYKRLRPRADGYPDPKTGENTAISAAARLFFTQVFVEHPPQQVATSPAPVVGAAKAKVTQ